MTPLLPDAERSSSSARMWSVAALVLLFGTCCVLRLYQLGYKAIMHDESLFVYYTYFQLYKAWNYTYLPILHGPTSLQLQALCFHLFGSSDATMRLNCALCGIGGFWFVYAMRPWLGVVGTWTALVFYTIAPGITFFQRFFHMDSPFLFFSLWIIVSFAYWWRSREPRWLVSAIVASMLLFTNKESSLFVYFSIVTFFVLMVLHDLSGAFLREVAPRLEPGAEETPRLPGIGWGVLIGAGVFILCLTQIFEGIIYDADVVSAIGHDWILKDVRSIPIALGWTTGSPTEHILSAELWSKVYIALFAGLLVVMATAHYCIRKRIGRTALLTAFWNRSYDSRYYLAGALLLAVFIYLWSFTTSMTNPIGFFEIYARTWSYWGGQHEWGRIGGPFYQHMLNCVVYELPSVLIVLAAWLVSMFRGGWTRNGSISFFLMLLAIGAFHSLLFSGLQQMLPSQITEALNIRFLKNIFFVCAALGAIVFVVPAAGRIVLPAAFFALIIYALGYMNAPQWATWMTTPLYKGSEAIRLSNRHVTLADYMEIQFNFDGGASLVIVLVLVLFATAYTWRALEAGERFHAFLVWWFVTSVGAASYAREAVPQVGIHAMMPLILLAASYVNRTWLVLPRGFPRAAFLTMLTLAVAWNVKTTVMLNFYNPDDVRERMTYGHTPQVVRAHANFITDYAEIAPERMIDANTSQRVKTPNDPTTFKRVRVAVQAESVIWEMRWYLRDIEWAEVKDLNPEIEKGTEFIFGDMSADRTYPKLAEKYHLFRGIALKFDMGRPADPWRLLGIWRGLIEDHYMNNPEQIKQLENSKAEWTKVIRFLTRRETFDGGDGIKGGNINAPDYIFAVRKDLY